MLTQFHTPRFSYLRRILVLPLAAFIFCSLAFVADKHPAAIGSLITTAPPSNAATAAVTDTTPNKVKVAKGAVKPPPGVYTSVETPPVFKGGEDSLATYLSRNIRYPKAAQEKGTQGTVFIQFIVDKDGTVKNPATVGKKHGNGLEEEAIRVVKGMPKWIPGKDKGKTVAVQFNLPIRFTMQEDGPSTKEPKEVTFKPANNSEVFTFVEFPPVFPGGEEALAKYLSKNLRYPAEAYKAKASGTVYVRFVVKSDGSIYDVRTLGVQNGYNLENEAIRVVKTMPKWKPGVQNNHQVNVEFNLPIRFTLQD